MSKTQLIEKYNNLINDARGELKNETSFLSAEYLRNKITQYKSFLHDLKQLE